MTLLRLDDAGVPMKLVFQLEKALQANPETVALTQALSLDVSRPRMGLRGARGLYGSAQWWESIRTGRMPLLVVSGVIQRVYAAGQDSGIPNNTIDLRSNDGASRAVGIYVDHRKDVALFRAGGRASIVYALDEMKEQAVRGNGSKYLEIALEMAVSVAT